MPHGISDHIARWQASPRSETESYSFVMSAVDGASHLFMHMARASEHVEEYINHEFAAKFGRDAMPSDGLACLSAYGFENLGPRLFDGDRGISSEQIRLYFSLVYHLTPPSLVYQEGLTYRRAIEIFFEKAGLGEILSEAQLLEQRQSINALARKGLDLRAARIQAP